MDWNALLARTIIAPLWARWEGSPYLRHYRLLQKSQFDDPDRIRLGQWTAIKQMLRHAHATVPFYQRRLEQLGLVPDNIRNFDDFAALPVLTKADIRAAGRTLLL